MQNNSNGPYDDVFNNLAKIVEDIVKSMPDHQNARIVGYTIITRQPSGEPEVFRAGMPEDDGEIPYEVTESEGQIFITAELPPDPRNAPYVDIQAESVRIFVDDKETTVMLDHKVDRIHSGYRVHRGVMDITLAKARTPD
ncbi:MAG TPA: hypothetical protein VLY83_00100 [Methanoregula sp.]|nr:hypothetical protein [Methanoregula sp.]